MNKYARIISFVSAILVLLIAIFAFVLSFDAIRNEAISQGIQSGIAWMVPFIIDGLMIVLSVGVLRSALYGEATRINWIFIFVFTGVSITFNWWHAAPTIPGKAMAILYPISLLIAFESFMSQIKNTVNRNIAMQENSVVFSENEQLKSERENLKNELLKLNEHRQKIEQTIRHEETNTRQKIEQEIEQLKAKRDAVLSEVETIQADKKSNELNESQRFMLAYVRNNPNASYAEIGQAIGRAPSTIGKYATELELLGLAHKNGNGWEVNKQ